MLFENASNPVGRLLNELLWKKPSFAVVVGYSWRLSEACSRGLRLLRNC